MNRGFMNLCNPDYKFGTLKKWFQNKYRGKYILLTSDTGVDMIVQVQDVYSTLIYLEETRKRYRNDVNYFVKYEVLN